MTMKTPTTTVGADTLGKLRRMYSETWHRDWPEPDDYLKTLWLEARAAEAETTARVPTPAVWQACLTLMRECHEFDAEPAEPNRFAIAKPNGAATD